MSDTEDSDLEIEEQNGIEIINLIKDSVFPSTITTYENHIQKFIGWIEGFHPNLMLPSSS